VGSNFPATFATWELGRRIIDILVFKWHSATPLAPTLEKLAVHVNDVLRSCFFVQIVDVLGAEK
jgi:hypothetical protein